MKKVPYLRNLHATMVKQATIKHVTNVLQLSHAAELAHTPGEQWPQVKDRQAMEILAVQQGKLDIIDRRSWQWPYLPASISRIRQPIIKLTPYNARRFSRTPVARRAINLIKGAIISLDWDIVPIKGSIDDVDEDCLERREAAKTCFQHPNATDSWQSFIEAFLDDYCTLGAGVAEPQLTPNSRRPFKMWPVDVSTVRIFPTWTESEPQEPHYAQMTGLKGERGAVVFLDNELMYVKDNPSTDTPFGTGMMEVAFNHVASLLGVQEMAGRAGSDQSHKTWLWWKDGQAPTNMDIIRRHLTNDIEGQAKINLISGMNAPEVITVTAVTEEDLLLNWQEMLIRMIANAFNMSPMSLGVERDVNRSTGEVLDDKDFRSAIVPVAKRLQEYFTRFLLHRLLGWTDLKFEFQRLDDPDLQTLISMLSQLYSMNAITPAEIRAKMGLPPTKDPFSQLTQFQSILLNTEAAAQMQDQNATKQFNRQQTAQQQMMEQYQQQQGPGNGSQPGSEQQGAGSAPTAPGLKVPKLKAPKLPKLPIAGSVYSAARIASMSKQEFVRNVSLGRITSNFKLLAQAMENQEPGILLQMEPELMKYLGVIKKAQQQSEAELSPKPSAKDIANQKKKFRQFQHQPTAIEKDLYRMKSPTKQKKDPNATGRGREVPQSALGKRQGTGQ